MSLKLGNTDIAGTQVLYSTTGNNTDGAMTQKATTTQLNLKANNADVVHKTGDETITGSKTFTGAMITKNISPKGNITLGTSTNTWGMMVNFQDTTGKRIARIQPMAIDTTNNRVGMWVNNADNSVEKGIYVDSNGTTYAPTPSAGDNSTKIATTAYVKNVLSSLYPVGSIYIGTQSTCPLATLISGSTWTKIGTSITTDVSIPSTIAVYGNGKTLGLTDGTYTGGITLNNNYNNQETFDRNQYNKNIGTAVTSHSWFGNTNKGVGVVQNTNGTSGLIAKSDSITYAKLTVNIWQRTV